MHMTIMIRRLALVNCRHIPTKRRTVPTTTTAAIASSSSVVSSSSFYYPRGGGVGGGVGGGHCHDDVSSAVVNIPQRAFAALAASSSSLSSSKNIIEEADFVEKDDIFSRNAPQYDDDDDDNDDDDFETHDDDNDDHQFSFPTNWCGDEPTTATYGNIINAARLAAEFAYKSNEAVVGALAEAGGDEGASERWLLGFLNLFDRPGYDMAGEEVRRMPSWWYDGILSKEDEDDDDDSSFEVGGGVQHVHREKVMRLAKRRNSPYFMKRCVDVNELRSALGWEAYEQLHVVAIEAYMAVVHDAKDFDFDGGEDDNLSSLLGKKDNGMDDGLPRAMPFSREAIHRTIEIWGTYVIQELNKKTNEEIDREQQQEQMEAKGMISKIEEGNWWGPATSEHPEEAYQRLIDGARFGTIVAYEQGEFIGAMIDTINSANDDDDDNDDEIVYTPDILGENAVDHFYQYLREINGDNPDKITLIPEWWNMDNDRALWNMASDKDSMHYLGHILERDDFKEMYFNASVRQKVLALGEVAKQVVVEPNPHSIREDFELSRREQVAKMLEKLDAQRTGKSHEENGDSSTTVPGSAASFGMLSPGRYGAVEDEELLKGKIILISGIFAEVDADGTEANRRVKKVLESFKATVGTRFSKNTNYLLAGKDTDPSKIKTAKMRSVQVLDLERLRRLLLGELTFESMKLLPELTEYSFARDADEAARALPF